MRKLFTIFLALFLVLSLSGAVFAEGIESGGDSASVPEENPKSSSSTVTYEAGTTKATWTVTVPPMLTLGESGVVKVGGTWAPSKSLSVKADDSVQLYLNGEETADFVTIPVTYNEIALPGDYKGTVSATEDVIVGSKNTMSEFMFGVWEGTLTFTINLVDTPNYAPSEIEKADIVTIASADELVAFATAANDNTLYQGVDVSNNAKAYVILTADIDMSNVKGWMPISKLYAKDNEHFNGTFDGKGHTISGLKFGSYNAQISNVFGEGADFNAGNYYSFGLFGVLEDGAVVKNFTLSNIYYGCYTSDGAAIVGQTKGNVTFENITVEDALIVQARQAGGIVGQIKGEGTVTFKNCQVNDSAVLAIASNVGALYGYAPDTVTVMVDGCSTTGSVIGTIQDKYTWTEYVAALTLESALADTNFVPATID